MTEDSSGNRWQWLACAGIAVALGAWFAVDLGREAPEAESRAEAVRPAGSSPPVQPPDPEQAATSDAEAPAMDEMLQPEGEVTALERAQTGERADHLPLEPEGSPADSSAPPSDSSPETAEPLPPAAPATRIAEGGRLSIDATSLRDGDVLALGLGLSDEARGEGPLAVRIASVDGRRIETTAAPADGSGSGLRLEIDPEWLTPGRYLIEVKTAEKSHFPLRRYVLEVSQTAPEPGSPTSP